MAKYCQEKKMGNQTNITAKIIQDVVSIPVKKINGAQNDFSCLPIEQNARCILLNKQT